MALKSTSKIRLFVSADKERDVLCFLQDKGVLEITSSNTIDRSDVTHNAEFAVSKLDFAIKYLSSFEEKKEGLRNTVLGEKIEVSELEVSSALSSFDWEAVVEKVTELEVKKTDGLRKLSEYKNQLSPLYIFKECDVVQKESRFSPLYFSIQSRNADKVEKEIKSV